MTDRFSKAIGLLVGSGLLVACGGSPKQPTEVAPTQPQKVADSEAKSVVAKSGPDCSDATCIVCGDVQCPKGFFCDESTKKATCQWVPTCAESTNCSCVERALGDKCRCSERDGGAHVRCSD